MNLVWQIPAVLAALLTWLSVPPQTIGEAADREVLRRIVIGKSTAVFTNQNLPDLPGTLTAASEKARDEEDGDRDGSESRPQAAEVRAPARGESWWRERLAAAQEEVERNRLLVDAMQARITSLAGEMVRREDPSEQAQLRQQLQKAVTELDRLEHQVLANQRAIGDIRNDARRQGAPAAWVR